METVIEGLMNAPGQTIKRKHETMSVGALLNPSTSIGPCQAPGSEPG